MILNSNTQESNLIRISNEYIMRLWDKGEEKSFKLVGIHLNEKLKWTEHINKVGAKVASATYRLQKSSKDRGPDNKKY